MAHDLSERGVALTVGRATARAFAWLITKTDGSTVALTDSDVPATFGGVTYSPIGAPSASARDAAIGVDPSAVDLASYYDVSAVTDEDLRDGLYDGATVVEYEFNAMFPWVGGLITRTFVVENVQQDVDRWTLEIADLFALLRQSKGRTVATTCDFRLGDPNCGLDIADFETSTSVSSVTAGTAGKVFTVAASFSGEYLTGGFARFTSGGLAGLTFPIFRGVDSLVTIAGAPRVEPQASDTLVVAPTCDGTIGQCLTRFSNTARFGGAPTMPGTDALLQTPEFKPEE
jgi:uncharacterized phage protein (TIGR02218 family)